MAERKTLKSVSIDDVKPRVTLTPIVEVSGETCRIHHIKSDSIAVDGRDTFVPLRHVSKQKRRIFELEDENAKLKRENKKLRELCKYMKRSLCEADPVDNPCDLCGGWDSGLNDCAYELQMRELGIEV